MHRQLHDEKTQHQMQGPKYFTKLQETDHDIHQNPGNSKAPKPSRLMFTKTQGTKPDRHPGKVFSPKSREFVTCLEGLVVLNSCSSCAKFLQAPIQHGLLPGHMLVLQLCHLYLQALDLVPVLCGRCIC